MVAAQGRCGRPRACGVFLLAVLLCALPLARAADAVDIGAVVGFTDTFQPGRWTPLSVTVTNRGGDLRGDLEVEVASGDEVRGRLPCISLATFRDVKPPEEAPDA